VLPQ
jgi:hypothetical protein